MAVGVLQPAAAGAEANPAGDTVWVVGLTGSVFVYDAAGAVRGSWQASDWLLAEGIATDGQHIWIVDTLQNRVYFYAGAAAVRSGRLKATGSFRLDEANKHPTGLTSDGHLLWVADSGYGQDRVFVYTINGRLLGQWTLDPRNSLPSGITLDRASGDLWVVDWLDAAAYRYEQAAWWTAGDRLAGSVYPLAAENRHPAGIADPAAWIQIGDIVSDTISVAGEVDEFVFEVVAEGQSIFVDFQSLTGGALETKLLRPGGGTVYSAANLFADNLDRGPYRLTAGTYTLQVNSQGTSTPAYRFRLWDVPPIAVDDTQIGPVNQGLIPSPGAAQEWRFEAGAGQSIYVDFQPTGGSARLETRLLAPDGGVVYTEIDFVGDALDRGPLALPAGGTYTLRVSGTWSDTAVVSWTAPPPAVAVTEPESGSELRAGSYAVLVGRATPGVVIAPVVAVTVNGRPVDALDAAGNFFALVRVEPGVNELTVEATDAFGQSGTAGVTLLGVESAAGQFAFDQARDATAAGRLAFADTFFNRQSHTLHAAMRLTNAGDDSLRASVLAVFEQISPPAVSLTTPEGLTPEKRDQDSFPVFGAGLPTPPEPAPDRSPTLQGDLRSDPWQGQEILPLRTTNPQVPPDRPYLTFDAASFDGDSLSPPGVLLPAETSLPIPVRFDNRQHLRFDIDVTLLAAGNTPPRFDTVPVSEAAADRPYRYAASASDADGDAVTYRLAAGPQFLTVDPHTGLVSGTPVAAGVGSYQVELAAGDGYGGTVLQTFQLQVWAAIPNRPPRFVTAPGVQAEPGADYVYAAVADDLDGDALRYTLAAAPPGMTVDEATGVVLYPQAAGGAHAVRLCVDDGRGGMAEQSFVLSVGSGESNAAPQFESRPPVRGVVGQLYLYPAAVTDPGGGVPQYALTQAPAGMTVDANTGLSAGSLSPARRACKR